MTCDIGEEMTTAAAALIRVANDSLLPLGFAPPPQLFVFDREADEQGLVAQVKCRPFYPGNDAAAAIGALGRIAGAIGGTDLLVLWEESDLGRAIYGPESTRPTGLCLVEAGADVHTVGWFPFQLDLIATTAGELPDLHITHHPPSTAVNAPLPRPMSDLLRTWRAFNGRFDPIGFRRLMDSAVNNGYDIVLN